MAKEDCPQIGFNHSINHCPCNPKFGKEGFCQFCFKRLVPIGTARANYSGTQHHGDWMSREYHKKCWKKLVEEGEYLCDDCGEKNNDFLQTFCECNDD